MPIKNCTLFVVITILLITGIKTSFAQQSNSDKELTLKKLTQKISKAEDPYNIKLHLNSKKSNQHSSISIKSFSGLSNTISKNFEQTKSVNKKLIPLSQVSTNLIEKNLYRTSSFPDNYKPWESTKHFGLAAAEELLFNIAIPWALARYGRDWNDSSAGERWPFIGFQSIWTNIQSGWNYDGDNFTTNMFAHPFGGNLFFNSGRTNGYNFWESSAFALTGSFIWETFMETNRPAINDWVNTGMNGAAFGEILYRLSTMVTDNTARGSHRVWTEVAGGIFNPVRFFTRLVTGELSRVFPNPVWRKPDKFDLSFDAGTRVLTNDSSKNKQLEGIFEMTIKYGDQYKLKSTTPFSYFHYNIAIGTSSPALTSMNAVGSLFVIPLSKNDALETTLNYNYLNNTGFIYGNAAVVEELKSKFKFKGLNLHSNIGIRFIPMGGTSDDYFLDSTDGRNYDFGQGLGAQGKIALHSGGWEIFDIEYTLDYIWTQSEPALSKHFLQGGELKLQLPIKDYFVFGVGLGYYKRKSYYRYPPGSIINPNTGLPMATPDVSFQTPIVRVYFRTRIL
jgi:Domain of unknown function (DUF3943)